MRSNPVDLRDRLAVSVARTAGSLSRRRGHAGSSLPGLIAERLAPGVSARRAHQLGPIAFVSGTNGKTTTTHLLDQILSSSGRHVITNRSGANLSQSVSTTVIEGAVDKRNGGLATAVLECDEFALPGLTRQYEPKVIVLTNLFRDQLDRFTEIDEIERRWAKVVAALPNTTIVAPADDPRLAWLACRAPGGSLLYRVTTRSRANEMGLTHDSEACPSCGAPLTYEWHTIGQLGEYACRSCGFGRPRAWLDLEVCESRGFEGQTLRFAWPDGQDAQVIDTALPGLANAYNLAAAVCAARALGIDEATAVKSLSAASNAWGRFETTTIDGHQLLLTLGKNPASLAELLRIVAASDVAGLLFVMNDGFQDGRDVSWYWDVNPAAVIGQRECAIAGTRSADLALRFKYELPASQDSVADTGDKRGLAPASFEDPMAGLRWLLKRTPAGSKLVAISTYTGMLELRQALVARHLLAPFPV